jgi:hypothetical protein
MMKKGYLVSYVTGKVMATVEAEGRGREVNYFFKTGNDGCPVYAKKCMLSFAKKHRKEAVKNMITSCGHYSEYFGNNSDYFKVI